MLENISYTNPELTSQINRLVGKPYAIWERFRQKGIGSQRLTIENASPQIQDKLRPNQINYCNIELRPHGIIIRFRYILETYGFVIPYAELLLIKKSDTDYMLQNKDNFLIVSSLRKGKIDHQFFERIQKNQMNEC